jgi:hypothetical protein
MNKLQSVQITAACSRLYCVDETAVVHILARDAPRPAQYPVTCERMLQPKDVSLCNQQCMIHAIASTHQLNEDLVDL